MPHASSSPIPIRVVEGVQVLCYPQGRYVSVAERLRAVHRSGQPFGVPAGEVLAVQDHWFYRATIEVNGKQYIGDADLHLHAPPETAEGSNPISCGQTSAIGQALEFAGFGDLKAILARLGKLASLDAEVPPDAHLIEGVQTVLLEGTPYVQVAERLFHLHQLAIPFCMERCEIVQLAGTWVYRALVRVGEQVYLGDAELFLAAEEGTPDHTHPITCGQISAVGNALAFAGFGDWQSLLERAGKTVPVTPAGPTPLASAEAVLRARQQQAQAHALPQKPATAAQSETSASPASTLARASPTRPPQAAERGEGVSQHQQQEIAALTARLGVTEPAYDRLDAHAATLLLAELREQEEELLRTADEAHQGSKDEQVRPTGHSHGTTTDASTTPPAVVEIELVRQLKTRWRAAFQPAGTPTEQQAQWRAFKTRICGEAVGDATMRPEQYDLLVQALPSSTRGAAPPPVRPEASSGTPVRQAPRLTPKTENHSPTTPIQRRAS